MPFNLTAEQLIPINLLLRIAVMAGVVSLALGFAFFTDYIVRVSTTVSTRFKVAVLLAVVFVIGVLIRRLSNQSAMDLSLEGALLAGFLGGTAIGAFVGSAIGVTCFMFGETVALPFYLGVGLAGGLLYDALGSRGVVWSYSLNPFLIIYNFLERLFRGRLDRNFIPFATVLAFAAARSYLVSRVGVRLYPYANLEGLLLALHYVVIVYSLGIGLKIIYNARAEILVREEERQLIHARLTTLRSQINPHFLFNTLNTISALIRTDPERAREMTRKLSLIFRRSLEDSSETHSLGEEIEFIDDYLSIERVRFGGDKLRVVKEIPRESARRLVPSMILQPIVENAVKHGIAHRTDGGVVRITARNEGGGLEITIENDGPEAGELELAELMGRGMGLRNVTERLQIYACGEGGISITPRRAGGAVVSIHLPRIDEKGEPSVDTSDHCR